MRRIPLSTLLLGGLLVSLVASLGLFAWQRHVENRDPIRREINSLIATLQNPVEVHVDVEQPGARHRWPLWPMGVAVGVGVIVILLRRRENAQIRSRNNLS
jgi:hypothetical protein